MKQYRPDVERAKMRYSMEQARAYVRRKRLEKHPLDPHRKPIPDNSEPWLPNGVKCVADALWISDQIAKDVARWNPAKLLTNSSEG